MTIRDLYNEFIISKQNDFTGENLEWELTKKLIGLKPTTPDGFNAREIMDSINPRYNFSDREKFKEYRTNSRLFKLIDNGSFKEIAYMNRNETEKEYLKLYCSLPDDRKKEFLVKYGIFVKENQIRGSYKIRSDTQANDLITIRVYNPPNYESVFNFVSDFASDNIPQHLFMPSINNIGITIDDGDSYNRFLSISLVKYFENCQDAEAVNDISFLKFVSSNEFKDQLDYLDKKHYKIYMQNLLNSFDKQLTKEDVFSTIKGMQQKIADYGFSSKKVSVVNDSLHKLTKDCICKGYDEAIINMSKFYFRDFNHFQAGLQTEEAQEILNFHLSKLESYD